jgi:hypothetical protein
VEEQQEYIEPEEPKREPEDTPTYPASPTTQAQALATSPSSTNTQEPCSSSHTGKVSPFPTPSRKDDSFLTSRNSDEYFWSRENSSGSEQESPSRHGEMPENTGGETELGFSLAGLDFHRPTSPASSLTDDEKLPSYIIRMKNDSESDGERQPLHYV